MKRNRHRKVGTRDKNIFVIDAANPVLDELKKLQMDINPGKVRVLESHAVPKIKFFPTNTGVCIQIVGHSHAQKFFIITNKPNVAMQAAETAFANGSRR